METGGALALLLLLSLGVFTGVFAALYVFFNCFDIGFIRCDEEGDDW